MTTRSKTVTGPYLDAEGTPALEGGGTALLLGNSRWSGPGGESVLQQSVLQQSVPQQKDEDIIVFHAYDSASGHAYLQISTIAWVDGWPKVALEGGSSAK
jgi:arabinan endo-1,5-alpha-L-arabinosidase